MAQLQTSTYIFFRLINKKRQLELLNKIIFQTFFTYVNIYQLTGKKSFNKIFEDQQKNLHWLNYYNILTTTKIRWFWNLERPCTKSISLKNDPNKWFLPYSIQNRTFQPSKKFCDLYRWRCELNLQQFNKTVKFPSAHRISSSSHSFLTLKFSPSQ